MLTIYNLIVLKKTRTKCLQSSLEQIINLTLMRTIVFGQKEHLLVIDASTMKVINQ
jgi:hypothetical protein